MLDGYDRLAVGIVQLAAQDYRIIRKCMRSRINDYERATLDEARKEIERFFLSDYGDMLCYGMAKKILEELRREND